MHGAPSSRHGEGYLNTQHNCDQRPYPPFPGRRDSRYIYITDLLFSATPPPLEKMFIAYFWH